MACEDPGCYPTVVTLLQHHRWLYRAMYLPMCTAGKNPPHAIVPRHRGPPGTAAGAHNACCTSHNVSGGRPTGFMRWPLDRDPTRNAPISCV